MNSAMNIETVPGAHPKQSLRLVRLSGGVLAVSVMDEGLGFRTAYTIDHDALGRPSHSWSYSTGRGRRVVFASNEAEAIEQIRKHLAHNPHI